MTVLNQSSTALTVTLNAVPTVWVETDPVTATPETCEIPSLCAVPGAIAMICVAVPGETTVGLGVQSEVSDPEVAFR